MSLSLEAAHVLTREVAEDESLFLSPLSKVHPAVSALPFDRGLSFIDKSR